MTTTQRVDVARFDCTNGGANWCNGCYTMERHDDGDYVLHSDYAALLQQLAERDAEIERLWDALAMANDQISELGGESDKLRMKVAELNGENAQLQFALENSETAFSAAERAREEATSLLYEADAYLCTARIAAETRDRIAAFLAANK